METEYRMSEQLVFYRARAAEARAEAEAATLVNVKERALRSEATWNEMARRVQDTERRRAARLADV
ncbi:hypothetical protein [Allosphingosinicella deserti]|nr:hypothetical protein [Sphingomonas deserti]